MMIVLNTVQKITDYKMLSLYNSWRNMMCPSEKKEEVKGKGKKGGGGEDVCVLFEMSSCENDGNSLLYMR